MTDDLGRMIEILEVRCIYVKDITMRRSIVGVWSEVMRLHESDIMLMKLRYALNISEAWTFSCLSLEENK